MSRSVVVLYPNRAPVIDEIKIGNEALKLYVEYEFKNSQKIRGYQITDAMKFVSGCNDITEKWYMFYKKTNCNLNICASEIQTQCAALKNKNKNKKIDSIYGPCIIASVGDALYPTIDITTTFFVEFLKNFTTTRILQ